METGIEVEVEQHQPLKLKNIRKDVFHYLKAVMEESRIFLPMKLPEEQEILPQPTPQMPEVVHVEVPELPLIPITTSYQSADNCYQPADNYQPELSASQTLASF